ncbi:MAG: Re/Si-specific NAD(P)(+) transhydrogenase subunit alpha [Candidatus Thiodiazotropha weberae]|nr:Re/Si-specific NAD(P)(+) transhydrogenase subunit alpha [Candidatus Thiodiazotropha lotti]MCG8010824.1 Re/Si-specific NAD(P)(+) transhydrogenase subunit alpha [Candidatus Thiodiazotropha lotti]MCG8020073.1 Re/Si-specific NAD(P)(+) transhydrogenase subunit alpha [Candidatus Thiodiazotropha lotti]MCW4207236.1 Re/Si-specific NAD(P)(+) transhydrogenase subunit alpha [Candidatus Thiodiazotropha lotti]MCW4210287.1 Re/Si-specific NAD(P)(+) transhydrogenase subunit alpha [Candidatus Thiodiazotropha 
MKIGLLKESVVGEHRVALSPDITKKLIAKGFEVDVTEGAGENAHFSDALYSEAGAQIVSAADALKADILVRVRKPSADEVADLPNGAILISHIESCDQDETLKQILEKEVVFLAMERIPRISRAQAMDALSSQSNIAGYRAVIEAGAHYGRFLPLMMTSAGSAKPARLVVLGAGVAGLQAIATAKRLGAEVFAYDIRPETKEQIESLGAKAIELDIGESGSGEGGYAKELSDEAKAKQQQALADELSKAHIIITTALIPCRPAPTLVTEEVIKNMREGSVVIDLAAANGGNCPLTEADKVVVKHGVTLVGHTNYPSMVPSDASAFYGGNIMNLLNIMVEKTDEGLVLKDLEEDEITSAMRLKPE